MSTRGFIKLGIFISGALCLLSFLMSVPDDNPNLLFLGYIFGFALVALILELPNHPKKKDHN